jgi:predicted kinase
VTVTIDDFPLGDPALVLTRGLPGSGKSSLAMEWVEQAPRRRVRVNRDDLRAELFNAEGLLLRPQEDRVTAVQVERTLAALSVGRSVVLDDTNLNARRNSEWRDRVAPLGVDVVVIDVRTAVNECIRRDRLRGANGGRTVGASVIELLAQVHLADGWEAAPRFI